MPPRGSGRGRPPRGGAQASNTLSRGGGAARGATRGGLGRGIQVGLPSQRAHVTTVGVKRPGFGTAGRRIQISANHFAVQFADAADQIHHYDIVITANHSSSEQKLPLHFNHKLISKLQTENPNVFTTRAVYDGRKNMFAARELPLGQTNSREFDVIDPDHDGDSTQESSRPPRIYKIKITKVANIGREALDQFIQGNHSLDNAVLTTITALNVVIRMDPIQQHAFNVRSFFTSEGAKPLGGGLELWRGYFQSIRPGIGRMTINLDIATGIMYKPGPLINVCLDFFGRQNAQPEMFDPRRGFPDRERLRLQRFLSGLKILTRRSGAAANASPVARTIKKLSAAGADQLTFSLREGGQTTVAQYFARNNQRLRYPGIICVEVGSGALIPLEMCEVPKGQIVRKQIPPDKTSEVVKFSVIAPQERLRSIKKGLGILQYGQSEYVREFGMRVDENPIRIDARVLQAPTLKYGGQRQVTVTPRDGSWNMIGKQFFKPAVINHWVLVVFERMGYFGQQDVQNLAAALVKACQATGMQVKQPVPLVKHENGQGNIVNRLKAVGQELYARTKAVPSLFVVVLPDGGNDIYTAIKHFGDCVMGVPTQCLKSSKCKRAKDQYLANIALKMNVKLGGINVIPDQASAPAISDPNIPTVIMGADATHPLPGSADRPSFTALVSSVDSNCALYVATTKVQTGRREIIEDLQEMAKDVLKRYMNYQLKEEKSNRKPARIVFYRDGVAEGQFAQVKEHELLALRRACQELGIKPKITMIIVGKRHHTRFFPEGQGGDRTGNCPAGTVVDTDIAHPVDFDFFLQSHAAILGTSRSAHYSVLYDENNFNADSLQALSYALCHVYARSTRSVSIPAPVYYADIVCSRAKNHYNPIDNLRVDESASASASETGARQVLEQFRRKFVELHVNQQELMYFSERYFTSNLSQL